MPKIIAPMADVVHMVDDRIDDKLATGACPRVISQATVTKTLAAYGALAAWCRPFTNFRPGGTDRKSSRNQIRTMIEASFCRNGAILWKISQRRRCVLTDNRFSRGGATTAPIGAAFRPAAGTATDTPRVDWGDK